MYLRVSPTFNAVAAPLLYQSICIGDKSAKGDVSYSAPVIKRQPRKSLTKAICLTYVKELEILAHKDADCQHIDFEKYPSLAKVDVLRLSLPLPDRRDTTAPAINTDHLAYGGPTCRLTSQIKAGKIVSFNTCIARPIHHLDLPQESLHTLVTAFTYDDVLPSIGKSSRDTITFKGSTAKSKQAIYVLFQRHWLSQFKSNFVNVVRDPGPPKQLPTGGPNLRKIKGEALCSSFVNEVIKQAMQVDFANDIVIVNINALGKTGNKRGRLNDDLVMQAQEPSYWKTLVKEEIASLEKMTDKSARRNKKTAEEAGKIKIRYISMEEYLKEYDWRGCFKESEVEEWLQEWCIRYGMRWSRW
jgi:hypothetical protein